MQQKDLSSLISFLICLKKLFGFDKMGGIKRANIILYGRSNSENNIPAYTEDLPDEYQTNSSDSFSDCPHYKQSSCPDKSNLVPYNRRIT